MKDTSVRNFLKKECNLSFKKITRHPAARNDETKIANRLAWVEKRSQTDMNFLENCVFIDESGFDINMRPPGGWSEKGTPAIVTTPSTRGVSHTVLGAITAKFIVSMELRNPQVAKKIRIDYGNRKRRPLLVRPSALLRVQSQVIICILSKKLWMKWTSSKK